MSYEDYHTSSSSRGQWDFKKYPFAFIRVDSRFGLLKQHNDL